MTSAKEKKFDGKNGEYLGRIFAMLKKMEKATLITKSMPLSGTELRLISEIIYSNYEGKRVISTQLAKKLDVTRSAISQLVKKLETDGIVKRVADENDKKIAYIELTEESLALYEQAKENGEKFVAKLMDAFGKEKLDELLNLSEEFWSIVAKLNNI
jgi:DNA-binding MarR family transcriptional regulator